MKILALVMAVMGWTHYPIPYQSEMGPVPTPSELLATLPALNPAPRATTEEEGRGYILWWPDHSQALFGENPPMQRDEPDCVTAKGEREPILVGLWGLRDIGEVTLKATCDLPVTVRVLHWYDRYVPGGSEGYDAVPGGRIVSLPELLPRCPTQEVRKGRNAIFWLTVLGKESGNYPLRVTLTHGQHRVRRDLSVQVLPLELPRADIAFGCYAPLCDRYMAPGMASEDFLRQYWQDMADHGQTSVVYYDEQLDPGREKLVEPETKAIHLEQGFAARQLQAMKATGLIGGQVPIVISNGTLDRDEDLRRRFAEEGKRLGLPPFVLYVADEPQLHQRYVETFEAADVGREYIGNACAVDDLAVLAFGKFLDVWILAVGMQSPYPIERWAELNDAELWTYCCWHQRCAQAVTERYYAGLYTWALRIRGNFVWAYHHIGAQYTWENRVAAPWYDGIWKWGMVIPSESGPIPGVNWEGRREGVEDYRLLRYVEEHGGPTAQEYLKELRAKVDWRWAKDAPRMYHNGEQAVHPISGPVGLAEMRRALLGYASEGVAE